MPGDQRFKDGQYLLVMTKQVGAQEADESAGDLLAFADPLGGGPFSQSIELKFQLLSQVNQLAMLVQQSLEILPRDI
jgi:hypothetical protein